MARYDPRYNYNLGYGLGGGALGLADILGQGFDRLHRINQDEQGQQNNQRDYLLKLSEFLSQNQDRGLDRQIKQQTADFQGKQIEDLIATRKAQADQAAAQRESLGQYSDALNRDVTTQEPAPQPPPQALAVSPQAEDRTFGQFMFGTRKSTPPEALASIGGAAANLPPHFLESLTKMYGAQTPKPPEFASSPFGIFNKLTGEIPKPPPEKPQAQKIDQFDPTKEVAQIGPDGQYKVLRPATPAEPKATTPSHERSLELKATAQLLKENGGVTPDPAAVADRALQLDEASKIRINKTEAQNRQDVQTGAPIPARQLNNIVDQYGHPITIPAGHVVTLRDIGDNGWKVLDTNQRNVIGQIAMIATPFKKMLDPLEHGKFPQAKGGSPYDAAAAYAHMATGSYEQYGDPEVANFRAGQQNILFPLLGLEGGGKRQAIAEIQYRMKANPQWLDTDVSAAAKAEQIAEIVESRLQSLGLQADPALQTQLDRAHEIAAKINARMSTQPPKRGFFGALTGAPSDALSAIQKRIQELEAKR